MDGTFIKHARAGLLGEAAALSWLAEAEAHGGMRVARVLFASDTELREEYVRESAPTREMARAAGVALAHTHAQSVLGWGAPPSGWEGAYQIAHSSTPCAPAHNTPASWGEFFSRYRIRAYLKQLPQGFFVPEDELRFEALCARLEATELDAPGPALVDSKPARVHGDLWAGNLLWSESSPTGAVLIDPMAHGGHAEEDLALLALFGCAYLGDLLAAYNDASPLADAWQERVPLMQLAPLLHHCVLFGTGYRSQTLIALAHCV